MATPSTWMLTVVVKDRSELDRKLDAAHDVAQAKARREGEHGILITRRRPTTCTVTLSDQVPYGTTREQYAW